MISYGDIKSGEAMVPAAEVRDWDLDLSDIRLDQSAQPREHLNTERTAEYAEAMKAGDQFPPLVVFHDGETYWLADGFHRHYAAQQAGLKHLRCYVRQGGLREAILWSVGANAKHGLPRTDEDKRRAVARLLADEEWAQWSDREIARRCRVSDKFVAKQRPPASADDPQIARKVQRGGTVYTQKVAKAAKSNAREALVNDEPSPEAGPQAEASLAGTGAGMPADREGRHEGEAASVDLPTNLRNIFDELVALWTEATDEDREAFIAYLRVSGVIVTESNPATGTGGDDVDRSAERASSAVKVGATSSPERATESAAAGSKGSAIGSESPSLAENEAGQISASVPETPATRTVPNARQADRAPEVAPPPASGASQFNNPRCLKSETCHLAHSRDCCFDCSMAWAHRPKDEQIRLWAEANEAAA